MQKRLVFFTLLILITLFLSGCEGMTSEQKKALEAYVQQQAGKAAEQPQQAAYKTPAYKIEQPTYAVQQKIPEKSLETHECTDSDYGKNAHDYGYTIDIVDDKKIKNEDKCEGNILYEAVCQKGFVKAIEAINCKNFDMACIDGTCKISPEAIEQTGCIDSDEGLNMMEYGFTSEIRNGEDIINNDRCEGNILYEAVCRAGATRATERIDCAQSGLICRDGKCVQRPVEDEEAPPLAPDRNELSTCEDSDNGINSAVSGRVLFTSEGQTTTWPDACSQNPPNTLLEQYCADENSRGVRQIDCTAEGKICENGACVARGTPAAIPGLLPRLPGPIQLPGPRTLAQCADTDEDDPETQGTVTLESGQRFTDSCIDENIVREFYCLDENNRAKNIGVQKTERTIDCRQAGKVCRDGRCVDSGCTDSDEGENTHIKGTVITATGDRQQDTCSGQYAVSEFTCTAEGSWRARVINCGENEICRDGACVPFTRATPAREPEILTPIIITPSRTLIPRDNSAYNVYPPPEGPSQSGSATTIESGITVRCVDYDSGVDSTRASKVFVNYRDGTTKEWHDACSSSSILLEQACVNGNTRQVHNIDCAASGKICSSGKCVQQTSSITQALTKQKTISTQLPALKDTVILKKLI